MVTVAGYTGVYDAASHGASGSAAGVAGDPTAAGSSLNLGESFTDVPGGTAYWTFTGGTNYNDQAGAAAIVIAQRPITITADPKTKIYGNNDPLLTAQATNVVGGNLPTGSLSRVAGEDVGTYQINQGTYTYGSNYFETYVPANLSITTRPITITANSGQGKVYGQADPTLLAMATNIAYSDQPTGSLVRVVGENVGNYQINKGSYTYGTNYFETYMPTNFTITPAAVTSSVIVAPVSQQFSDLVSFTATLMGGAPQLIGGPDGAAQSATFKVGTQVIGTASFTIVGSNLVAALSGQQLLESPAFNGQMTPGSRTVTAVINSPNNNYSINSLAPTTNLSITHENASVVYSGLSYFSTASASSCSATVSLMATVTDAADGNIGDVRYAKVTFRMGTSGGAILGTAGIPVQLVSNSDTKVGIAATSFVHNLSGTECTNKGGTFEVYVEVSNYYTGNNGGSDLITISVPGSDAVTGGGFLVMGNSAGTYAGTTGTKTNFGFTMKYTKNGGTAKGQANIIVRSNNRVYQIKSNAINSLTTAGTQGNFSTKANLRDITNPLAPISLGGNLDLAVDMNDVALGGQTDEVSFRLMDGSTLLYSSNWTGSNTARKVLGGGNISVRNGAVASAARTSSVAADASKEEPIQRDFSAYPNPFDGDLSFAYSSEDMVNSIRARLVDMNGREIHRQENAPRSSGQYSISLEGKDIQSAIYILQVSQGNDVKYIKVMKK